MPVYRMRIVAALLGLALSAILSLAFAFSAFADEGTDPEEAWSPTGTCEWKWDAKSGSVTVRPANGAAVGTLSYSKAPWEKYKKSIKVIEFEGKIAAPSCSMLFYDFCSLREIKGLTNLDTSKASDMSYMFAYCSSLESLDLSMFDTSKVKDMSAMFAACNSLKSIDVSSFDTSNVTKMGTSTGGGMFFGCESLEAVDVSGFDTSKVEHMGFMFSKCPSLKSLDLSKFNTSCVTSMGDMFWGSTTLESVDLSGFDTRNVYNMTSMFADCVSLKDLDLSSFDTSNVTYMTAMFARCPLLSSLDLTGFNTGNAEDLNSMFRGCESLGSLDLSTFATAKVVDMGAMFGDCHSLKSLDVSNFDTSSATNIAGMFYGCSSIKSLDLSNFDTSKVEDMYCLFQDCFSMTSINISNFKLLGSCRMDGMFDGCRSLSYVDMSNLDSTELDIGTLPADREIFPDASDSPKYKIQIGPKFTLQPYLTMGYWVDAENSNGTWPNVTCYEEYAVPFGVSGTYEYCGGIKSMSFDSNPVTLIVGDVSDLPVSYVWRERNGGYGIIWTSSNPAVVRVDTDAPRVYPLAAGTATISATIVSSGLTCSCNVVVKKPGLQNTPQPDVASPNDSIIAPTAPSNTVASATLKGSTIKKLTKLHKGFTVKWSKLSSKYLKQIIGYKIRYSTFKSMKKPKTKTVKASSSNGKKRTFTVTKLKSKKKYYVQIATFKKVGDETYYSKWSKVKSVKTK